ncbi:lycopene cyclase domain-containing protein [Patescibacteria group bacterium]
MPEYFVILLILLLVTIFLHRRYKIKVFKSKLHLIIYFVIILIIGIIWDHIAISRGHWLFGEKFLLGLRIGLMPIEELGFILILGYFGPVIWKVIEKKLANL